MIFYKKELAYHSAGFFLSVFSLILEVFPEDSGSSADMLFKIITERRRVFEAAG